MARRRDPAEVFTRSAVVGRITSIDGGFVRYSMPCLFAMSGGMYAYPDTLPIFDVGSEVILTIVITRGHQSYVEAAEAAGETMEAVVLLVSACPGLTSKEITSTLPMAAKSVEAVIRYLAHSKRLVWHRPPAKGSSYRELAMAANEPEKYFVGASVGT